MNLYDIVFSAELVPGAPEDRVRENLARLFQADAQRIELLFSGRRLVLKSNLEAAEAEKYRATIERAGARVEVVPVVAQAPLAVPASASAPVVPRDAYMAAFSQVEAPDYAIAEVGSDMQERKPPVVAPPLDLSQFSVAAPGSDMGQQAAPPAPAAPDTSHLKLS